jgi:hypothetical protein
MCNKKKERSIDDNHFFLVHISVLFYYLILFTLIQICIAVLYNVQGLDKIMETLQILYTLL